MQTLQNFASHGNLKNQYQWTLTSYLCFSSSYSVSEFFDAREYTTDAGDDSDSYSTEDEDIDEEDDDEEDEGMEDENEPTKMETHLESPSSRDDSEIVSSPKCHMLFFIISIT